VSEHFLSRAGIKANRKYRCTRQLRRGGWGKRDEFAGWRIARSVW